MTDRYSQLPTMVSIDQNSHSLWDCLPKLQTLARRGIAVTHHVEDIDVAFTTLGAHVGDGPLHLARERFHRSGGADWGAALFYNNFLGRLAVEIRHWEPLTGMQTATLAKHLGRSVDELYDEFSPSENWQLIGPSYVGDDRHHRTIGDLSAAETAAFLREILGRARTDTLEAFPDAPCRLRTTEWFDAEQARLEALLSQNPPRLVDLYKAWMDHYLSGTSVTQADSSGLFAFKANRHELLVQFIREYDAMAGLYNRAIEESHVGLRPLHTDEGELPFFAVLSHQDHCVRSGIFLEGGQLRIADRRFDLGPGGSLPLEAMAQEGITCLAGKAIVLVLQVRTGPHARPLVLPYRGSMYMPAAYRFQQLLREAGKLTGTVHSVYRVKLGLLDALRTLDVTIHLPAHLRGYFGRSDIPARELGESYATIAAGARERLAGFRDETFRTKWVEENFADLQAEITALETRKRKLAATDPKNHEVQRLWQDIKLRKVEMLDSLLRQINRDWQAQDLDYYDSRGAILPWCIAMAGQAFYDKLLDEAKFYPETPDTGNR